MPSKNAPVAVEAVESELAQIKNRLRATGERELDSRVLGELVMEALKRLDQVAYVRLHPFTEALRTCQSSEMPSHRSKLIHRRKVP